MRALHLSLSLSLTLTPTLALTPTLTLTLTLTPTLALTPNRYTTWGWARHWRAVKAQAWGLPLLWWWGPCPLSNVPQIETVTVATFDAFPASRYRLDQLAEAHAAYCAHLKACFDSRKAECGAAHKELVFIGSRQPPPQAVRSRL